ncbi:5-oxoprolinase subunit PxpB [Neobacillus cucumis]|uniref:5-oxoprolinase subunit PxpB n=1 Tax=Neobacillus cucumis TaxID=1740721 RepID=UPI0019627BCB|nr:5-oxoprolinase subunit PxpB [Neobacillus cucumis]MBM7651886.1 inhibitor of KinA [Neobacillus cucumis]
MIEIKFLGDSAIQVSFGNEISEQTHFKIQTFMTRLKKEDIKGIIELVPAYCTIAIYYQPTVIRYEELVMIIEKIYACALMEKEATHPKVYEIPVYYGGETGPDLSFVARTHDLSEEEVIQLHSSKEYLIHMMGFVPGFPYLGGLPEKLAVPRLEHPRPRIPSGSVGIGGNQTGIYPAEVPSGWRIIGITPVKLFDVERRPPFLFEAGNYIKFYPIDFHEYKRIQTLEADQTYELNTIKREINNDCD